MKTITLRPSLVGAWFMFAGFLLAIAIVVFEQDSSGKDIVWYGVAGFFLVLLVLRLTQRYELDDETVCAHYLLGSPFKVRYREITEIELRESFAGKLVGTAHLLIHTKGPILTLAGIKDAQALRDRLLILAGLTISFPKSPEEDLASDTANDDKEEDEAGDTYEDGEDDEGGEEDDNGEAAGDGEGDGNGEAAGDEEKD
ncbi:MAG: hypothetical protein LBF40_02260 [Deltaproteobacteria bacterium]|jgi:hypothetical protein|nr:hypothetical protein [Deltaproteobacteria bacterium]